MASTRRITRGEAAQRLGLSNTGVSLHDDRLKPERVGERGVRVYDADKVDQFRQEREAAKCRHSLRCNALRIGCSSCMGVEAVRVPEGASGQTTDAKARSRAFGGAAGKTERTDEQRAELSRKRSEAAKSRWARTKAGAR